MPAWVVARRLGEGVLGLSEGVREWPIVTVKAPEQVRAKPDAVCVAAVEVARAAAIEEGGAAQVGDYLTYRVEGERLVTHYFVSTHPGYVGWCWAVTVTRAARAKTVTIDEVVMLPGDDAIVAPPWVPWSERVQPGDLRPGDLYPTLPDDPRLVPGFTETGAPDDVRSVVDELGLGRKRVLSAIGRDDAAERWYHGEFGPESPVAQAAPYRCHTCGYWVRLGDSLGQAFGVCANEMGVGEGRVVAFDYGCGAHSDVVVDATEQPVAATALDTTGYDDLDLEDWGSASETASGDGTASAVESVGSDEAAVGAVESGSMGAGSSTTEASSAE